MQTRVTTKVVWVALLLVGLTGCPQVRPGGGGGGGGFSAQARCGEATAALAAGRDTEAEAVLRQAVRSDPAFASDAIYDVCLGRALLGQGQLAEARVLLERVADDATADAAVRRSACVYAMWSHGAAGEWSEATRRETACRAVGPLDGSAALLERDLAAAALTVVAARLAAGRVAEVVGEAGRWLQAPATTEATRQWLLERLLSTTERLGPDEVNQLAQQRDDLSQALAAFAELRLAVADGAADRAQALAPAVRARLSDLGATTGLHRVDQWLADLERSGDPIVGSVLSLSGSQRQVGRAQLAGLLLAQAIFSESGGERTRLVVRDVGESSDEAARAVGELANQGVLAVIGPFDPELAEAVEAAAAQWGLAYVGLSEGSEATLQPGSVQLFPSPAAEADALVRFALSEGLARVAIAVPDPAAPYLLRLVASFESAARQAGITLVDTVSYRLDDLQSEAQDAAERLARRSFDALLVVDHGINAMTLAAYLGVEDIWTHAPGQRPTGERRFIQFLGTSFWHNPDFLSTGPDYLAGGVFPAWLPVEIEDAGAARFAQAFELAYGRRPAVLGAYAHDALLLLHHLMLDAGIRDRAGLQRALREAELMGGATGPIRFDAQGHSAQEPHLLLVTSSGFEPL